MIHTVTGEFDAGKRTQKLPWSTPLTHNSWKVACAETDAAREATKVAANNILILRKYHRLNNGALQKYGKEGLRGVDIHLNPLLSHPTYFKKNS